MSEQISGISITFILFIILILIICFIVIQCITNNKYGGDGSHITPLRDHSVKDLRDLEKGFTQKTTSTTLLEKGFTQKKTSTPPMSITLLEKGFTQKTTSMLMSYTISGEGNGLDFSQLRKILKECNGVVFVEKPITETVNISFGTFGNFMINGKLNKGWHYDPAFFKQKSAIKNTLGNFYSITTKSELYNTIKKLIPNGIKYLPKNYTVEEFEMENIHNFDKIFIVKKNNSCQQKGVFVITSKQEYHDVKEKLHKLETERANIKKVKPSYEITISEYITNPLLLDGKKIHLRVYYVLSVISGITRCITYNQYRIYIAEEQYKKGDWLNPNIHISGVSGKSKNRRHYWPDDISANYDIDVINQNMDKFNKVMCIALTIANIQNYSESNAGYHLYGADVLITDHYHPYLLEINSRCGFKFSEHEKGWEEVTKTFSYNLFSFILNSTVFPFFGIVRPPIYTAEFIGNGILTPFANILIGDNKCILIPYLNATQSEINNANGIKFFNKSISLSNVIENCSHINIYLIRGFSPLRDHRSRTSGTLTPPTKNDFIIGYLSLDNNNYLQIVIIEEFQNRGIATAMIAQFLEIYYMQYFTTRAKTIFIDKKNTFMAKIALKLHFIKNSHNNFEYNFKRVINTQQPKNNLNKLLTYKIIYSDINNKNIDLVNVLAIDKYMTESKSQFVSFVYYLFYGKHLTVKNSTGSKYDKNFVYQGAELKSTLDIKILVGLFLVKLWAYQNKIDFDLTIFDKRIENKTQLNQNKQRYTIYNKNNQNYLILDSNDIKEEYYNIDDYIIEEYNPPYLLDGKFMYIKFIVLIYVAKNGIIKFYINDNYYIVTPKDIYSENLNNFEEIIPKYKYTDKKYNLSDLDEISKNYTIHDLYSMLIKYFHLISQYDIKPYVESNSGFLECEVDFKFIKKDNKYQPVIGKTYNVSGISQNKLMDENVVNKYYQWITNCIILPHFGLSSYKNTISPNYGIVSKYITLHSNTLQYSIMKNIHLEMIPIDSVNIEIQVNILSSKQDHIKLHITSNYIYITSMPNLKHDINIIFMLMELLRAYYAPIQMFLLLKYEKKMDAIAFELEFSKKDNNYYIKKC
jgi:hypothetical protein